MRMGCAGRGGKEFFQSISIDGSLMTRWRCVVEAEVKLYIYIYIIYAVGICVFS